MTLKNYFEKTGKIYGISTKYNFGHLDYYIKAFDDLDAAYKWCDTEECDFRTRELGSKTHIAKIAGIATQKVNEALIPDYMIY